jgi:N-acetylmuramoyl-L-alanine amidase
VFEAPRKEIKKDTQRPTTLRDVIIAIDAGHGGDDPGAIGPSGTYEKDVVLKLAKNLAKDINKERGMHAVLIREGDYYIKLRDRI